MKYLVFGLIASIMIMTGCASSGDKTAVTVYDSTGKVVQETSKDAVALQSAYTVAAECEKTRGTLSSRANLGVMNASDLKGLSPSAQTEYMRSLPILHMSDALKSATAKQTNGCQQAIVAYYNHLNVAKTENASLWRKLIGIGGFIGGAYVIGNSVESIVSSLSSTGSTTNTISDSRVNQDSGNNYSSPYGNANTQMENITEFAPIEPVAPVE